MKVKDLAVGAGAAVGFILLLGWIGSCSPPWDTAEAKELRARSDSLALKVRTDSIATARLLARNDSVNAAVDSANVAADSADARAERESLRASQTAARLRRVLAGREGGTDAPDNAQALLDTLEAQHAAALAQKDVAIAALRTNVDRLTEINGDLALQLVKVQSDALNATAALEAEVAFWQEAAESQRGGLRLLGLRVPGWVAPVAAAAGGVYVGTLIAR